MAKKAIPLSPSQSAEDGGLLDMSLEEIVNLFIDREKQRSKLARDDENQQEALVGCRYVPVGLVMALDGNARILGITRRMLTKCASHQIAAWLDSLERVSTITSLFNATHDAALEFGYPDLYRDMSPSYLFANNDPRQLSLCTINWVKSKLSALSLPLGIPAGSLFVIGLCYSLTRSGASSKGTITKYLSQEVSRFLTTVDERSISICAFNDKVRRRAAEDGLDKIDG